MASKAAVSALRGESEPIKPRTPYTGKTYNSSEAIAEFFKKKEISPQRREDAEEKGSGEIGEAKPVLSTLDRLKASGSKPSATPVRQSPAINGLVPGTHVRHEKYGRGLVLRREGSGENAKLTVSFPGFGQKKLIEKFAKLQKD